MLSLQETTVQYMYDQFQPELLSLLVDCCTTLSCFAISEYEDDLINLIAASDDMSGDDVRDNFVYRIRQALEKVIDEHMIKVDPESEPTLSELNDLAKFIYCIQDLEETSAVEYRLHGAGTSKQILLDIMSTYSKLYKFRAMEIISSVDDKLIKAMQAMVKDKAETTDKNASKHLKLWREFTKFLGLETHCLGLTLRENGYFGLKLKEVNSLLKPTVPMRVKQIVHSNIPQTSLDLLSVLLLCSDTYEDPMGALSSQAAELFMTTDNIGQIKQCMNVMYLDFNNYLQAAKPGLATQQETVG